MGKQLNYKLLVPVKQRKKLSIKNDYYLWTKA